MKRFLRSSLSIFLAITIIFSSAYVGLSEIDFSGIFTVKAKAASYGTTGECTWSLSGGVLTISGNGPMGNYRSSYGLPWGTSITRVVIENGVTSIGAYSFRNCTRLTSVLIPDSVTSIGGAAFFNCTKLISITIPDSVTYIGKNAFYSTGYYRDYSNWESGVLYIGNHLIEASKSLSGKYIIKSGTKTIAASAFSGCRSASLYGSSYCSPNGFKNLVSIVMPDSVTSIGSEAFSCCTALTGIEFSDNLTRIGSSAFSSCTNLKSIKLPSSVTSIGSRAFYKCTSLASIEIPEAVTSIGSYAFAYCSRLASVEIPKGVTNIGSYAFYKCTNLTSVNIPSSYTSIGSYAFAYCTSLASIEIPDGVTSIGSYAFAYCSSLASIEIPEGVRCIYSYTFYNCTSLESIIIPDSVTSIGSYAFAFCTSLTSIDIPEGVTNIDSYAFKNCTSLTSIEIPDGVTDIGVGAFYNCTNLTFINMPYGLTSIGSYAFSYCTSLESITIPDGVTSIGSYAFYNCTNLTSIDIPEGITSIYTYTFYNCKSLELITIPESVASIGSRAFYNCTNLNSVIIGSSVRSIGSYAFQYCRNLTDVYYHGTLSEWTNISKYSGNGYLTRATIHYHEHNYSEGWVVSVEPTCTEAGSKHKICFDCGGVVIEEIPATGHDYDEWEFVCEPTCTEWGSAQRYCNICGKEDILSSQYIDTIVDSSLYPESPHNYGNYFSQTYNFSYPVADKLTLTFSNSTYTESGYDYIYIYDKYGTLYGKYSGSTLAGKTITLQGNSFSIKLTSDYSYTYYGFSFASIVASVYGPVDVMPLGHDYSTQWTIDQEVTCTEKGIKSRHCTRCESRTDIIYTEPIGHHSYPDEWTLIKAPTCTENGLAERYCNVCGNKDTNITYNTEIIVDSSLYPESAHDYESAISETYNFSYPNTNSLTIKFSSSTYTEPDYDYIYIYDKNGVLYGGYTGSTLAGKTITLDGDSFTIKLTSDGSINHYGFSLDSIVADGFEYFDVVKPLGHNYSTEWTVDVAPTCTEVGSKSRHCTRCGNKADVTVIDIIGHSYVWEYDAESLIKTGKCSVCGATTEEVMSGVDVLTFTLNSTGNGYTVTDCLSNYLGEVEIPESYNGIPVTSIGTDAFRDCIGITSVCIPNNVKSIGGSAFRNCKNLTEIELPDNITSIPGAMCFGCAKLESVIIPDGIANVGGYAFSGCSSLKYVFYAGDETSWSNITIGSNNAPLTNAPIHFNSLGEHSYSEEWTVDVEPTCAEEGSKSRHCTVCGDKTDIITVDPTNNHVYSTEWTVDVAPTCTEEGSKSRHCTVCGDKVDVIAIEVIAHNYSDWVIDSVASCNVDGVKHKTCSNCDDVITETTPATHQNTLWITEKEPTCVVSGSKDEWCLNCGEILNTEEIPALGHSYSTEWTVDLAPTCVEFGIKSRHCTVCDDKTDVTVIEVIDHDYSDWVIDSDASCTVDGIKHKTCSSCGDVITETIPAAHQNTLWITEKEPNCVETGSKDEWCLDCGAVLNTEEISALGHSYSDEWTVDVAPTCTEEGSKSHHCTVCDNGMADITVIEPLGHDYKLVSTNEEHPHINTFKCFRCSETKQEESYAEKCEACNFSYTDNGNGTCTITGYIGSSTSFVLPATIEGKAVQTTKTGAFKNNTTITSVEIENGVKGIGSLAFLGCTSLTKVVIPESVTSIGVNAFYNCASDFTIYCYRDSYAMQYAIDNSIKYIVIDITGTENCVIDYENNLIFATITGVEDIEEILNIPATLTVSVAASFVVGDEEYLGTGSIVAVTAGDVTNEYTLVVNGDTNGDSVCDVLDCFDVERASNGNAELSGVYAMAADNNSNDCVDINDYQNIVNQSLAQ